MRHKLRLLILSVFCLIHLGCGNAFKGENTGASQEEDSFLTPISNEEEVLQDLEAPSIPLNLMVNLLETKRISFSWSESTDSGGGEIAEYQIYRDNMFLAAMPSEVTTFTDENLVSDTTYTYLVRAVDTNENESDFSEPLIISTLSEVPPPPLPDTQAPSVPQNLRSTNIGIHEVSLSWSASSDLGGGQLAFYKVYRNGTQIATLAANATQFTDKNLADNTNYTYQILAVDDSNNESARSTSLNLKTLTIPPPPVGSKDIKFSVSSLVFNANTGTRGSAVGDFDNDGRDEFVGEALKIFDWNGSQWISYSVAQSTGHLDRFAGDGEVMDIDNDGYLDIVQTDTSNTGDNGSLVWFKNPKGDLGGKWIKTIIYSWDGSGSNKIRHSEEEVADINGDGFQDIVVRGITTGSWIFINKMNGTFHAPKFLSHNSREGLALADIDKDGDLDIIINGIWFETPNDVVNGNYVLRKIKGMENWYPTSVSTDILRDYAAKVRAVDVNKDGKMDIIISNSEELTAKSPNKPHGVHVFLQPSDFINESWVKVTLDPDHYSWHSLQVKDLNNDGNVDIIASISTVGVDNAPFETKVWQGNGDGSFKTAQVIGSDTGYQGILGDYDGDGYLDYFLPTAFNLGSIRIYRNQSGD